jgi:hypothetical protein
MLLPSSESTEKNTVPPPEALQAILTAFHDIFAPPTRLSPHRDSNHNIPLIPGVTPPNIRPYRMSHCQKDTIETIIK